MTRKFSTRTVIYCILAITFSLTIAFYFFQSEKPISTIGKKKDLKGLELLQIGHNINLPKKVKINESKKRIQKIMRTKKRSFKVLPGEEIISQYEKNEGSIKNTIKDFKKKPSVKAEVTIPF